MQFIDLQTQYQRHKECIDARINKVLSHGRFILGPEVAELEEQLAHYVGVKHCLTVSNGTDALLLALMALGVGRGDEVITSGFSFFAAAEVIILLGAKPVFVDIDPLTYNLNPALLEQAITPKTKVIMPVSLYGQSADMDAINAIAAKYQLPVIEDAAQSFGGTYKDRPIGSLGTIACTSFYPAKALGCYGEGGACFTNDNELADTIRKLRNHGQESVYYHTKLGINGRLATLQAAILLAKLEFFPEEIVIRNRVAQHYNTLLSEHVQTPMIEAHNTSVYAQYTINVSHRDALKEYLQTQHIPTAIHYPIPIYMQPAMAEFNFLKGANPVTEAAATRVLSLPMHAYLETDQIEMVAGAVIKYLREIKQKHHLTEMSIGT